MATARPIPRFEELVRPLPLYSLRRWFFASASATMRSIGRLSEGIRIGYGHGFDSGVFMQYVYENTPRGALYLGKRLDRAFLNQVTCRAFRVVKDLVKTAVEDVLRARGARPTLIADLAAGPGAYLMDLLADGTHRNVRLLLRDLDEGPLEQGRALAERMGLADRVRFERGDALDPDSLRRIDPKPDVVLVVGLHGTIHEDARVYQHLNDIGTILAPSALIFTCQAYNPHIEFIARVWKGRGGQPCLWRLRPLETVTAWAREAGFPRVQTARDPFGIYGVITAWAGGHRSG